MLPQTACSPSAQQPQPQPSQEDAGGFDFADWMLENHEGATSQDLQQAVGGGGGGKEGAGRGAQGPSPLFTAFPSGGHEGGVPLGGGLGGGEEEEESGIAGGSFLFQGFGGTTRGDISGGMADPTGDGAVGATNDLENSFAFLFSDDNVEQMECNDAEEEEQQDTRKHPSYPAPPPPPQSSPHNNNNNNNNSNCGSTSGNSSSSGGPPRQRMAPPPPVGPRGATAVGAVTATVPPAASQTHVITPFTVSSLANGVPLENNDAELGGRLPSHHSQKHHQRSSRRRSDQTVLPLPPAAPPAFAAMRSSHSPSPFQPPTGQHAVPKSQQTSVNHAAQQLGSTSRPGESSRRSSPRSRSASVSGTPLVFQNAENDLRAGPPPDWSTATQTPGPLPSPSTFTRRSVDPHQMEAHPSLRQPTDGREGSANADLASPRPPTAAAGAGDSQPLLSTAADPPRHGRATIHPRSSGKPPLNNHRMHNADTRTSGSAVEERTTTSDAAQTAHILEEGRQLLQTLGARTNELHNLNDAGRPAGGGESSGAAPAGTGRHSTNFASQAKQMLQRAEACGGSSLQTAADVSAALTQVVSDVLASVPDSIAQIIATAASAAEKEEGAASVLSSLFMGSSENAFASAPFARLLPLIAGELEALVNEEPQREDDDDDDDDNDDDNGGADLWAKRAENEEEKTAADARGTRREDKEARERAGRLLVCSSSS